MEATTQLSDVIKLGKRLVAELNADESRDTLSHWMTHHIAGLIQRLERKDADDRLELEAECRRAVLELWAHRSSFRSSARPFAKLEQLLNTLEAMDPDRTSYFYFRELNDHIDEGVALDEPNKLWLKLARSIDSGARTLISYCISRAAADAADESAEWVALAQNVESKLDADIKLVRIVIQNASALKDALPTDELSTVKDMLHRRIESLDGLADASENIRSLLLDRIAAMDGNQSSGHIATDAKDTL